jgi:acyl-coenzyme A synthetase/AMP-(fatty) acid ligase
VGFWLTESMAARADSDRTLEAIHDGRGVYTYGELTRDVGRWRDGLLRQIAPRSVVAFDGDYDRGAVSLLVALVADGHIVVPVSRETAAAHGELMTLAGAEYYIASPDAEPRLEVLSPGGSHPYYETLRQRGHAGLVLFTSGSTGAPKGAVHDMDMLLKKFQTPRQAYRTLAFLQLDHIGGLNTLFYTLANGGALVFATERAPAPVCAAIARHRVGLLPTSPTFLNLLLLSEEHTRHDLSSLALITYGTEPMPESTLRRVAEAFPDARLLQTYGSTEIGILRSQSKSSDSVWVRVGGEGFETKIVDGRLWIRAESAMLGYLNAPSPFDADGFYDTGDMVERDGDWLRIIGRESELINVGGSKVFPAEVESVLLDLDNVADVAVHAEASPITGHVVAATVLLIEEEPLAVFKQRMRQFCSERLSPYKVPVRVRIASGPLHSHRFKRQRSAG